MENETAIAKKPETFEGIMQQFKERSGKANEIYHLGQSAGVFEMLYDSICWDLLPKAAKMATTKEQRLEVFKLTRERQTNLRSKISSEAQATNP
jgi:hypothetical protein